MTVSLLGSDDKRTPVLVRCGGQARVSQSVHTFATVYSTTFLSAISLLLPTRSLLTPSVAYLSISCSHCFTLLKESMSVTS